MECGCRAAYVRCWPAAVVCTRRRTGVCRLGRCRPVADSTVQCAVDFTRRLHNNRPERLPLWRLVAVIIHACVIALVFRQLHTAPRESLSQQKFYFCVHAAQVARGQSLQFIPQHRVNPQGIRFFARTCHARRPLVVESARVDDRLGFLVRTQHHQQIADHGRLALVVELDNAAL